MTEPESRPIDSSVFREVLGQYPTGVSVVTAAQSEGKAVGLAVGSFTSVSLDPPLVAFVVDRASSSWPKIQATGAFCANVLGADQEHICRVFASKAADKFADLEWSRAASGSPILDGAVAWIDCRIQTVHEAGDHFIVIGEVLNLAAVGPKLPLLFFRGGYGSFSPSSSIAVEEDLLEQLRLVDPIRPAMEAIASDLDVECNAAVLVGDEIIHIARAGRSVEGVPTRVGRRLPFRPPVGFTFASWGSPATVERWLHPLGLADDSDERRSWERVLTRVRHRGYSVGLGKETHEALWARLTSIPTRTRYGPDPDTERMVHALLAGYDQRDLAPGSDYDVRTIAAPVLGPEGHVVVQLTLYGLPPKCSAARIERFAKRLLAGAEDANLALAARDALR